MTVLLSLKMILEKPISISIKHETVFKDETDTPIEELEEMNEKQVKEEDKKASQLMEEVAKEVKDIMNQDGGKEFE